MSESALKISSSSSSSIYWPQNTQLLTILLCAGVGQICCKNDWGQDFYLLPNDVPTTCRHLTCGIVGFQLSCINQQPWRVSRAATHSLQRQRVLIRSCRAEARSARAECVVEVVRCAVCYIFETGESRTWVHTCWFGLAAGLINITTFFTCSVSMNTWELAAMFGLAWLIEFCHVALSCFTLSRLTTFPDVLLIKPEDSFSPLFKVVLYSVS